MSFLYKLSRRGLIRVITLTLAVILALGVYSISASRMARRYSMRIQFDYEQQLDSLATYLSQIDNGLKISAYISTPEQFARVSSSVWQNCGSAKACVSALPTAVAEFDNTYRFLSQAGEYMKSLSVTFSASKNLSDRERSTLKQYSQYASQLCTEIAELRDEMETQGLWNDMAYKVTFADPEDNEKEYFYAHLKESESALSDIPDPVYSGPFSSHITNSEAQYLKNQKEITLDEAQEIAAKTLQTDKDRLKFSGESTEYDKIPAYRFESGVNQYIAITKQGGKVAYFLKESFAERGKLSEKQALSVCSEYLEEMGYKNFKATHYQLSDSSLIAEFCYVDNSVVCLTDVIKLSVELDSSKVMAFDARQFLMNNKTRNIQTPKHTKEQALHVLSPNVTMQSVSTVIIPSDSISDVLCYQFICRANDNTNVIIYINCETLEEEKIVLIDEASTGVHL